MTKRDARIYLGKGGRAHGPFEAAEIQKMRLSGEIEAYTFIWDTQLRKWLTLDTPPPDIGVVATQKQNIPSDLGTEAICHGSNTLLGGVLENLTELGCDLVSTDTSESPALMLNSMVLLNVTDTAGDQGKNLKASLAKVSRREGKWIYGFRWAQRPTF